jgi:hypothetical protein
MAARISFGIAAFAGKNRFPRPAGVMHFRIRRGSDMEARTVVILGLRIKLLCGRPSPLQTFRWIAGLAACISVYSSAYAQNESSLRDLMQARNYGMGGAYHALGLGAEAVDGNPAAMPVHKFYEIAAAGAWDLGTKFGFGSLTVLASQTSSLAAGASYHFVEVGRGDENRHTHFMTLALALPLADSVMVGVSGHYALTDGAFHRSGTTVDAGLLVKLSDAITLSASGHNLVDIKNPDVVRYYVGGVGYSKGLFTFAADVRADFASAPTAKLSYHGGLEYIFSASVPLRAGYTYDSLSSSHFVSGGLGFLAETGGLDFAYRHEIGGNEGRLLALTFRFRL